MNTSNPVQATAVKRIGIFGGTFDPVHNAHLALAQAAAHELQLDELIFMPAGMPWQKSRVITPAVHRIAMLELALQALRDNARLIKNTKIAQFRIDPRETMQSTPSFTVDALRALHAENHTVSDKELSETQFVLLIGGDQWVNFHTWKDWQSICGLAHIAVAQRAGQVLQCDASVAAYFAANIANHGSMTPFPMPQSDISASQIRVALSQGQDCAALLPASVAEYCIKNKIYTAN